MKDKVIVELLGKALNKSIPLQWYKDWLYAGKHYEDFDTLVKEYLSKFVYDMYNELVILDAKLQFNLGVRKDPRINGYDLSAY